MKTRSGFGWGLLDQVFSSGTNFALSVLAGRLLGPGGLGVVFVGFSAYLLVMGFQRSLVIDPLVVGSAALSEAERRDATARALTSCLAVQAVATGALLAGGIAIPGTVGRGMIVFAPWIPPLLLQDLWRSILFRDHRGGAAALNDGVWGLAMAAAVPLAFVFRTPAGVAATWATGATVAALFGFAQVRTAPAGVSTSLAWWRRAGWALGRWLGLESIVFTAGAQGTVFLLASILGASTVGGLRAVQSIFAPMTLLSPAINLPGLPAVSRALASSFDAARKVALRLSAAAGLVVLAYLAVLGSAGVFVLGLAFGDGFRKFSGLIVPVGAGQIAGAAGIGFALLLKADGRGRALVWSRVLTVATALSLVGALAPAHGVRGAAWGMAVASLVGSVATGIFALRRTGPSAIRAPESALAGR